MSLEEGLDIDDITIMEERSVAGSGMAVRKEWHPLKTVRGRATNLTGGNRAVEFFQRGFKRPWSFMFMADPSINEKNNRIRYVDRDGVSHDVEIREFRRVRDGGGDIRYYVAEGEELTQRPK